MKTIKRLAKVNDRQFILITVGEFAELVIPYSLVAKRLKADFHPNRVKEILDRVRQNRAL